MSLERNFISSSADIFFGGCRKINILLTLGQRQDSCSNLIIGWGLKDKRLEIKMKTVNIEREHADCSEENVHTQTHTCKDTQQQFRGKWTSKCMSAHTHTPTPPKPTPHPLTRTPTPNPRTPTPTNKHPHNLTPKPTPPHTPLPSISRGAPESRGIWTTCCHALLKYGACGDRE